MDTPVEIFHNPRCSKSRATLELLREQGIEPAIIEYLKVELNEAQLGGLIDGLGGRPSDLLRKKEGAYTERGLTDESTRAEVIAAILAEPILLERPVVRAGERVAIGRPPGNVLKILNT
jgi:arsenate reductase